MIRPNLVFFSLLSICLLLAPTAPAAAQDAPTLKPAEAPKSDLANPFGKAAKSAQKVPVSPAKGEEEPLTTLKLDVKLVSIFATVVDLHGAPVGGLNKENFVLSEDGHEQKISVFERESALPVSIVLALDTSLSTRRNLPLEVQSAKRFSHAILRAQDVMSLYSFSEVVDEVVPFTANVKQIERGLDRMHFGAATALYDAVQLGSQALLDRRGRKVMVVITDGGDTVSSVDYQAALRSAQEAEAIIYSIIVVPIEANAGRDLGGEHALIQIAEDTGGKHYYAATISGLDAAFQQISDELRTQYLLGYYPSQRLADSEFRRIQVQVQGSAVAEGLHVRHRAGYYTAPSR